MAQRTISARTYVIVCVLLVLLTFLTVGVSFFPLGGPWHIVIGLAIAMCNASFVVLFFMHVLVSPKLTWIVIAVSAFWVGVLFVLTMAGYFTRDLVLWMPGHQQ
jgi:cytochrome c oxidase subunit 4